MRRRDDEGNRDVIILPDLTASGKPSSAKVRNHTHASIKKIQKGNWLYRIPATVGIVAAAFLPWYCTSNSQSEVREERESAPIERIIENEEIEQIQQPERPLPFIQVEEELVVQPADDPVVPREADPEQRNDIVEKYPITNVNDFFLRYPTGDGPIEARLLYYEGETLRQGNLHNISAEAIQRLVQYFEETATFYTNGDPLLEEVVGSTRGLTLPMSQGNLRIYNVAYQGEPNSDNIDIDISQQITETRDRYGHTDDTIEDLVDRDGKPLGAEVTTDRSESTPYARNSRRYTTEELERALVRNQNRGNQNYLIIPKQGSAIISSVPNDLSRIAVQELSALFGMDDQFIQEYIRGTDDDFDYGPRGPDNPDDPDVPDTHDPYRFDPLSDDFPGDNFGDSTMGSTPRENPMDDHNTGGDGDRPYRPRN
jgi:hypothetical protein